VKVLQDDPGRHERDFPAGHRRVIPAGQCRDMLIGDRQTVALAQRGFQENRIE
jgi:hypothetical protein